MAFALGVLRVCSKRVEEGSNGHEWEENWCGLHALRKWAPKPGQQDKETFRSDAISFSNISKSRRLHDDRATVDDQYENNCCFPGELPFSFITTKFGLDDTDAK